MKPEKRLKEIGWVFDEDLMVWHNEDMYVDLDGKYVDIYIYNDGKYKPGYLTYEELVLFGKWVEENYDYEQE